MIKHTLYKLEFPNGKCYIGRTTASLDHRLSQHVNSDRKCRLSVAIKELKDSNQLHLLKITKLLECKHWALAYHKESWLIKHYQSNNEQFGYNGTRGGVYDEYDRKINPKLTKYGISKHNKFYNP